MAGVLLTLDALVDDTVDEVLEAAILFNIQKAPREYRWQALFRTMSNAL